MPVFPFYVKLIDYTRKFWSQNIVNSFWDEQKKPLKKGGLAVGDLKEGLKWCFGTRDQETRERIPGTPRKKVERWNRSCCPAGSYQCVRVCFWLIYFLPYNCSCICWLSVCFAGARYILSVFYTFGYSNCPNSAKGELHKSTKYSVLSIRLQLIFSGIHNLWYACFLLVQYIGRVQYLRIAQFLHSYEATEILGARFCFFFLSLS